jgi:hypothetical protein
LNFSPGFTIFEGKMSKRYIIHASDIEKITGFSKSFAEKRIQLIKSSLGKKKYQHVTIKEYCDYEMFNEIEIRQFLQII